MIDVLSSEQARVLIKQRKQEFELYSFFYVLTPLNHVFYFWSSHEISICDLFNEDTTVSYKPEIAKLYGVEYDDESAYIKNPKDREHLYELFISDPGCMLFRKWKELTQELQHRGLI